MAGRPDGAPQNYLVALVLLAQLSVTQLFRSPSHSRRAEAARHWARRSLWVAVIGGAVVIALMFALDARGIVLMPARGSVNLWPLRILTDSGKGAYVLELLGALLLIILLVAPALQRSQRLLLITFGTRIQFLFFAVLVPVLLGDLIKGLVGRGRPFVGGEANAFNFSRFAWTEIYASFPSGHAVTAFALAFAVSALWPRMRTAMMIYALVIGVTRLVLLAHHPSDIVAGALLGMIGAMFVRYWFAARHLAFTIRSDGTIVPLAGPSWQNLNRQAARPLLAKNAARRGAEHSASASDRSNNEL
jgi:membrane-associated phospholipid phosphatase